MKFRDFFILIFVLFSLYLMGDAFSRWDGLSYYLAFSEFLPSVALASILWSLVSVFTAILIWILFKLLIGICNLIGIEIEIENLLFCALIFILFGGLAWKGKKLIWPDVATAFQIKIVVFLCIFILSILTAWLFRNKAKQWTNTILERITPLAWLFGILVMLAVPLVAYYTWIDGHNITVPQTITSNFSAEENRPNIILVTFDALAARNMSAYGYRQETTPFISKWSKKATVFTMAEASSNFTTPAVASLMTGKRVWTHQTYHIEGSRPINSKAESLPAVLKDHGYFNIALVVNPFASVKVLGMSESFDVAPPATEFSISASLFGWKFGIIDKMLYRAFGDKIRMHNWIIRNDFILSKVINLISRNISQTTVPPEKAFDRFLDIVDNGLPRPFFAWIHVFPPHDPYLPPESFMGDGKTLREYKSQEKLIEESYKYLFEYKAFPEEMKPSVELMESYYDEFIRYCDRQFENFIEKLNEREIRNTVFILSADHGESFEHGYLTHGGPYLYEQVTHIPLIIKEAGQTRGKAVSALVEQIDIPPTVLELAEIPVPFWMEGRSLVSLMHGWTLPVRPAFTMNLEKNRSRDHQITNGSIAIWDEDYKMIHYLDKRESLLFNIKEDPEEMRDLFDEMPEVAHRLQKILLMNLGNANERIKSNK